MNAPFLLRSLPKPPYKRCDVQQLICMLFKRQRSRSKRRSRLRQHGPQLRLHARRRLLPQAHLRLLGALLHHRRLREALHPAHVQPALLRRRRFPPSTDRRQHFSNWVVDRLHGRHADELHPARVELAQRPLGCALLY